MNVRIVFTGGGTGGHIYPAIAIADALGSDANVTFIGSAHRLEARLVPQAGYRLRTVASRPLTRRLSFDLVRTIVANLVGVVQSARILRACRPQLVVATGGYVCFPVVLAARALGVRVALLELNAQPGLTNRLLAPFVSDVWTGIPVRASLRALPTREVALARFGLDGQRRTLLVLGGSQGARSLNDAVLALLTTGGLPDGWQAVLVTGERDEDHARAALAAGGSARDTAVVRAYLDDPADAYAAADLVLARAGASTLGELAFLGKPAVLVPYPHASDDHQRRNAERFAANGAAVVIDDSDLATRLRPVLAEVSAPARLAAMHANAQALQPDDPIVAIRARIDALIARKDAP